MKKLLIALMAVTLVMSAGCAGAPTETTTTTPETTPAITEIAPEETADENNADDTEAAGPDEAAPAEDNSAEDNSDETGAETPAVKLTQAIVDCGVELPMLMIVDDTEMLTEAMGYDLSIMDDYCIRTNIMSAQLVEFSVIKPAAGKEQEVLDMLNARMNYLKDTLAWYPDQVENADATIVSSYNGYVYLLCEKHSAEEETALKKAIDEM